MEQNNNVANGDQTNNSSTSTQQNKHFNKDLNSANTQQSTGGAQKSNSRPKKTKRVRGRHVDNTIVKDHYKVGETVDGKILLFFKADKQHNDKSALVKLPKGGIALLHHREILGHPILQLEDQYKVGDKITAQVVDIKPTKNQISVSLIPIMWKKYAAQLERGTVCEATIVGVEAYGYFVDLGCGMRALLHRNELQQTAKDRDEKFQIGDVTTVVVLRVNEESRQIGVGRKQLL